MDVCGDGIGDLHSNIHHLLHVQGDQENDQRKKTVLQCECNSLLSEMKLT